MSHIFNQASSKHAPYRCICVISSLYYTLILTIETCVWFHGIHVILWWTNWHIIRPLRTKTLSSWYSTLTYHHRWGVWQAQPASTLPESWSLIEASAVTQNLAEPRLCKFLLLLLNLNAWKMLRIFLFRTLKQPQRFSPSPCLYISQILYDQLHLAYS